MRTFRDSGADWRWIRFLGRNGGEGSSQVLVKGVFEVKVQETGYGGEEVTLHWNSEAREIQNSFATYS